jgi:hypothetical protein
MTKFILTFIVFTFFSLFTHAQSVTISGHITDAKSGETLIGASIYDANSKKGSLSNAYGFYSLTIPKGVVNLSYFFTGYTLNHQSFDLTRDTIINVRINESVELKELVVIGNQKNIGVQGSQMSTIDVPISLIKTVPSLFGEKDVIKALQLLPGVKAGVEGSAGLYIRGGGADENLLLLDGVPVYNVNHMFGFFSIFNADAIKNVTLYKGSFPARFGGRLSSVVDIRMKDGDNKKLHGSFSLGLISAKMNLEGPLGSENTTFNVSARRTYADLLAQPFLKSAIGEESLKKTRAGYYFYDVNAKITHKFSDKDRIYLSAYVGNDVIYTNIKQSEVKYTNASGGVNGYETNWLKMDWNWGNIISALRWNHVISNKLFMNATGSYTRYGFDLAVGNENQTVKYSPAKETFKNTTLDYDSGIEDISAKIDFDYSLNANNDIKFGTNYTFHRFRPGVTVAEMESNTSGSSDTVIGDQNIVSHEAIAYVEDNISISHAIKANIGVHYSSFLVQNHFYNSVQPRLGIRYLLNEKLSLKAGYASMSQYIHLLSNNNVSLPTDLWVPVTKRIEPMKSQQVTVGTFYNLNHLIELSVEGYYKSMDNLIEYKDGASFFGSSTGWEDKVSVGRGWAYGVELLAQKSVGKTTGWIGYTWAKSERLFDRPGEVLNSGKTFPTKYDRRHDLSIVVSHKFSEKIDVSATWVYSSGSAGTLSMQNYLATDIPGTSPTTSVPSDATSVDVTNSIPYISSRNNYRYEPYHRLDVSINFNKKRKHGIRTWNISIYNVYNQLNPFLVTVKSNSTYNESTNVYTKKNTLIQTSIFPIIPSISYSYKF